MSVEGSPPSSFRSFPLLWDQLRRSACQPIQRRIHQRFVFAQPSPGRRQFDHHVPTHHAKDRPAQEHRHAQGSWLPIGRRRGGLVLVKAQQVEGEQDGQEGRLSGEEGAQTEALGRQVVLEFLDALLHAGPPVVVAPQLRRPLAPVGHPDPEGVAGHVN